jgi:hypothetical protein
LWIAMLCIFNHMRWVSEPQPSSQLSNTRGSWHGPMETGGLLVAVTR